MTASPIGHTQTWPAPGTYTLQAIQRAPDGVVLDSDGTAHPLSAFTTGRVTLLGFIYTYCTDPAGCPLAYDTFVAVREALAREPALARRVRLVSLSFDPTNDTPGAMRTYGGRFIAGDAPRWRFLTTRSVKQLTPILDAFGQDVSVQPDRVINHMLKVFLIDPRGVVREIYSTAFLRPDVVLNDIRTLLLEDAR